MIVCANHNQTQATAYCRTCGKPLCDECKRDVRGVIYCEECIAARLAGTLPTNPVAVVAPPPGLPNPTLAAFLGLIPGVGAFYNGQYQKGVIHLLWIIMLGNLAGRVNDGFAALIPFSIGYFVWDAYKTAKARITGEPVPDPFGLNDVFGVTAPGSIPGAGDEASVTPRTGPPLAAIVLIVLGCLFLFGEISGQLVSRGWPLVFVVVGVLKVVRRWQVE
jgi:hypothetical protein